MDILLITTTAQHSTSNPNVILDPRQLAKWIDQLPDVDLVTTVKKMHTAIEDLNELIIDDRKRLRLLQVFYDALQDILISYDEMRISMLNLSAADRNKLREDIMWLYLSLANGYKHIVLSGFERKLSPGKDPVLLSAIFSSLELIISGLLYSYRSHLSPPPLARLEINQLYYYAQINKVADIPVKGIKGRMKLPTINRIFKQYVLMSVSDPYRLNPAEMLELYMFLETVADTCIIESATAQQAEGKYAIDLMQDSEPVASNQLESVSLSTQSIFIDIWPIVNTLAMKAASHDTDKQSFSELQERHMIDIIIEKLGKQGNKRSTARKDVNESAQVVLGIENINAVLTKTSEWNDVSSNWQVKNKSANGMMMLTENSGVISSIVVGDIMLLRQKSESLSLANIRWLRREHAKSARVGIELLTGYAVPVFYEVESGLGLEVGEGDELLGLYFNQTQQQAYDSLIILKDKYNKDSKINIHRQDEFFSVRTTAILLDSPLYIYLKVEKV